MQTLSLQPAMNARPMGGLDQTLAQAMLRRVEAKEFVFVEGGRHVLTDGEQTLELIDVGPNPHAKEMLVAWLPKQRVVFQGDLFFVPNNDAPTGPPQTSTISFAQKLKDKGLAPQRIASVHGRTASFEEFARALEGNGAKN